MAVYFVETSALAKRYIAEVGSLWLRALLDPSTGCSIYVVRVTAIEMIAAITRRERGGTLAPTDAATTRQAFRRDLATAYQVIEVTPALANRAMLLSTWTKVLPQFTLLENQSYISSQTVGESLRPQHTVVGMTHTPKTVTNNTL